MTSYEVLKLLESNDTITSFELADVILENTYPSWTNGHIPNKGILRGNISAVIHILLLSPEQRKQYKIELETLLKGLAEETKHIFGN